VIFIFVNENHTGMAGDWDACCCWDGVRAMLKLVVGMGTTAVYTVVNIRAHAVL